jgi:hypothetical protein
MRTTGGRRRAAILGVVVAMAGVFTSVPGVVEAAEGEITVTTPGVDPYDFWALDLGAVEVGQFAEKKVVVSNTGDGPLVVSGAVIDKVAEFTEGEFRIVSDAVSGRTLQPGESGTIVVRFTATSGGPGGPPVIEQRAVTTAVTSRSYSGGKTTWFDFQNVGGSGSMSYEATASTQSYMGDTLFVRGRVSASTTVVGGRRYTATVSAPGSGTTYASQIDFAVPESFVGTRRWVSSGLNAAPRFTGIDSVVIRRWADGWLVIRSDDRYVPNGELRVDLWAQGVGGPALTPLVPARLMDSRGDGVTVDGQFRALGVRGKGSTTELRVTGRGGVPASASAVFLNVTAVTPQGSGFLTVFPCGASRPTASNVNYVAGDIVPNAVLAKVGSSGKVCVYTHAPTHLVVDVNGYVPAGAPIGTLVPARLMDSRGDGVTVDGQFRALGVRGKGSTTELRVTGRGGVPASASAVFLNVTAVTPQGSGFLTVFPCGASRPTASNVNYVAGDIVPNAVLAKVGSSGKVCVYTHAPTHLVVDVNGYVPAGAPIGTLVPARLMDSRGDGVTVDGQFRALGVRGKGSTTELRVTGRGGVPASASAVFLNVTAVTPQGSGFLTVFPCGASRPTASNVNYVAGDIVPNAVLAKVGSSGKVCVYTHAPTHLVVDVNGYVPG